MSRYDGLIIPRSYSEYLNKTDSATLSQMLQHLTGLWSHAVSAGDQKPVTSDAVNGALTNYINKTDAATLQQALQLPGVLSGAVAAGDNKAVTSNAVNAALTDFYNKQYVDGIVAKKTTKVVTLSWDGGSTTPFVPFTTAILDLSDCNHIYAVTPRFRDGGEYTDRCLPMVVGMTGQPKKYYIGAYSDYAYNNPFKNVNVYCDILYD